MLFLGDHEKICNRCKVIKNKLEFDEGQNKCRKCKTKCEEYYKQNKPREVARALASQKKAGREKINAYKRTAHRKNPKKYMIQGARQRAKEKGVPFDLTENDIVIPTHCPVLGHELKISDGRPSAHSPSIDRITPEKGYVKNNIQIISWRANDIKGNATIEELKKLIEYMEFIERTHCGRNT